MPHRLKKVSSSSSDALDSHIPRAPEIAAGHLGGPDVIPSGADVIPASAGRAQVHVGVPGVPPWGLPPMGSPRERLASRQAFQQDAWAPCAPESTRELPGNFNEADEGAAQGNFVEDDDLGAAQAGPAPAPYWQERERMAGQPCHPLKGCEERKREGTPPPLSLRKVASGGFPESPLAFSEELTSASASPRQRQAKRLLSLDLEPRQQHPTPQPRRSGSLEASFSPRCHSGFQADVSKTYRGASDRLGCPGCASLSCDCAPPLRHLGSQTPSTSSSSSRRRLKSSTSLNTGFAELSLCPQREEAAMGPPWSPPLMGGSPSGSLEGQIQEHTHSLYMTQGPGDVSQELTQSARSAVAWTAAGTADQAKQCQPGSPAGSSPKPYCPPVRPRPQSLVRSLGSQAGIQDGIGLARTASELPPRKMWTTILEHEEWDHAASSHPEHSVPRDSSEVLGSPGAPSGASRKEGLSARVSLRRAEAATAAAAAAAPAGATGVIGAAAVSQYGRGLELADKCYRPGMLRNSLGELRNSSGVPKNRLARARSDLPQMPKDWKVPAGFLPAFDGLQASGEKDRTASPAIQDRLYRPKGPDMPKGADRLERPEVGRRNKASGTGLGRTSSMQLPASWKVPESPDGGRGVSPSSRKALGVADLRRQAARNLATGTQAVDRNQLSMSTGPVPRKLSASGNGMINQLAASSQLPASGRTRGPRGPPLRQGSVPVGWVAAVEAAFAAEMEEARGAAAGSGATEDLGDSCALDFTAWPAHGHTPGYTHIPGFTHEKGSEMAREGSSVCGHLRRSDKSAVMPQRDSHMGTLRAGQGGSGGGQGQGYSPSPDGGSPSGHPGLRAGGAKRDAVMVEMLSPCVTLQHGAGPMHLHPDLLALLEAFTGPDGAEGDSGAHEFHGHDGSEGTDASYGADGAARVGSAGEGWEEGAAKVVLSERPLLIEGRSLIPLEPTVVQPSRANHRAIPTHLSTMPTRPVENRLEPSRGALEARRHAASIDLSGSGTGRKTAAEGSGKSDESTFSLAVLQQQVRVLEEGGTKKSTHATAPTGGLGSLRAEKAEGVSRGALEVLKATQATKGLVGARRHRRSRARDHVLGLPYEDICDSFVVGKEEIGSGQFGIIRKCVDRNSGKQLALKTVAKTHIMDPKDAEDLRFEVQCLQRLRGHPAVISLHRVAEDERSIHLVLDLCKGGDLFDRIKSQGPVPERAASRMLRSLTTAVMASHQAGIIHRDIKPENILLCGKDPECDRVKLIDFGIAAAYRPGAILDEVMGTPYYMAPEVYCRRYGPECDIWSLGVTLHVMLSGLPPFWASKGRDVSHDVMNRKPGLSHPKWKGISEAAKDLVRRMLVKDPLERISGKEILEHEWIKEAGA